MARKAKYRANLWPALALAACVAGGMTGCSLERYAYEADREARCLVAQKSNDPRWALPGFTIQQDPRSRYADPCNEIRPPMPPDDPASHHYMRCVDGKRGWAHWYANGCRRDLENPCWEKYLGQYVALTDDGAVKLSLDSAVEMALIHSPSFQKQLEEIYLSALDVSTERYRFDVRFFGGNATRFSSLGPLFAGGADRVSGGANSVLTTETDFQFQRRFATAGELAVGFANAFVWQFAGDNTENAISILNFTLTQPLLRGAGRDVALEQLTIAERTLLANLRAFQRYRQGFYTQVALGQLGVRGPNRRGGFFGGTGLTGFTGTGSGGFGGVGEATQFGGGGFSGGSSGGTATAGFAGGGAGQVGGFIGLLQRLQELRNLEESLNARLRALGLLEAHLEAGTIDLQQVDQFRQSIETDRANLLQARNAMESRLESFKTGTLGMPPDLPMVPDDSLIRQFQIIDPAVNALQQEISDFREAFGELPLQPRLAALQPAAEELADLNEAAAEQFEQVELEVRQLLDQAQQRRAEMDPGEVENFAEDLERLIATFEELQRRMVAVDTALGELRGALDTRDRRDSADRLASLASEVALIVDELSLVQARTRLEQVSVEPIELQPERALAIARTHRLDWMNNRAALVDTWRLIAFNADALQSDLDVTFSGDLQTTQDNPFRFRGPAGRLSVGLEFDGPFDRLRERNTFRQVLIDYQQDRRDLIQYEDGVYQTLRGLLRDMREHELNLEIQRRAVVIAIRRVDQTREVLNKPPEGETAELGPTAALNLTSALSDLRSAQNNFMSVWLNFLATRMTLMRELGIMRIDERGMWVDEPLPCAATEVPEMEEIPPPVPREVIQAMEIEDAGRPGPTLSLPNGGRGRLEWK